MKFCCYCCSVPKLYIALCKLHGLLHTRLLCPPLSPGVCLHSCPIESVMLYLICCPFSFCLQSFPASGSFPMGQLFISGGQSIGDSVLPMNIQGWFLLGLTGLISLLSKGLSRVFSSTTIWKHQFFSTQLSLWTNSHICTWLLEKYSFDYVGLCWQSDISSF